MIEQVLKVRQFLLDEYSSAEAEAEGYPVDRECRPAWDALHEVLATLQGSAALPSERIRLLLDYDFGDESPHCIALAEVVGELIAMRTALANAVNRRVK